MESTISASGRRRRRSLGQIKEVYAQFEQSNDTAGEFSRKHGFAVSTLYAWRRRLQKQSGVSDQRKWVEAVHTGLQSPSSPWEGCEIRLPDGVVLRLAANISAEAIVMLVRKLRGA